MLSLSELDSIIDIFVTQLRRRQLTGSSKIAKHTAEILREVAASFKKTDTVQSLIDACYYLGRKITASHPTLVFIGNIVRRVLYIIRDEYASYLKTQDGAFPPATPKSLTSNLEIATPTTASPASFEKFKSAPSESSHQPNLATLLEMSTETDYKKTIDESTGVDFKGDVIEQINELIDELELLQKTVSEQAVDYIHTNEVILTIGMSHTVEQFLIAAANKKRKFDVIVTEDAPSYGGHEMVQKLSKAGISATLISDAAVFGVMSRVNKVVLGVHAVMANGGLLAPCGTHTAALAAKKHSIPVVVCIGIYKLTPLYPLDQDSFNDRYNPAEIIPYEDGTYLDRVQVINPAFDYVPPELVELFVTNLGAHNPSYIYRLLAEIYDNRDYNLEPATNKNAEK